MQFSTLAVLAASAVAVSAYSNGTVVYTTDIVTAYTTYCPEATSITLGESTYTVFEATTLTITNCPCTIVKPVTTSAAAVSSSAPPAPVYANSTTPAATAPASVGTSSAVVSVTATPTPSPITTSSGNKLAALSGGAFAGLLAVAAYVL